MHVRCVLVCSLLTLGLGQAAGQDSKQARALFEAMEQKLSKAKTVHLQTTSLVGEGDLYGIFKGQAWLGEGGAFKLAIEAPIGPDGGPLDAEILSDGTEVTIRETADAEPRRVEAPQGIADSLRRCASRVSVFAGYMLLDSQWGGGGDEPLPLKNFKLGPKERDGGRAYQVIEYQTESQRRWAGYGGPGNPAQVKLWIDTQTGLPHKRTVTLGKARLEESYEVCELDVEIAPGTFGEAKPKPFNKPKPIETPVEPKPPEPKAKKRRWF